MKEDADEGTAEALLPCLRGQSRLIEHTYENEMQFIRQKEKQRNFRFTQIQNACK